MTKYSKKNSKFMEQIKSMLIVYYWFILCFGLLPLVLKKNNNSSKLFYTVGLLRNSVIDEEKNEKLKLNKIKFSCGFNKILNIELEVIK
jgi:hypothetical protein